MFTGFIDTCENNTVQQPHISNSTIDTPIFTTKQYLKETKLVSGEEQIDLYDEAFESHREDALDNNNNKKSGFSRRSEATILEENSFTEENQRST